MYVLVHVGINGLIRPQSKILEALEGYEGPLRMHFKKGCFQKLLSFKDC